MWKILLAEFWNGLTREARDVLADVKMSDAMVQLEALADYHLDILIKNAGFINLSFALRRNNSEVSVSRDHLRHYVAVFDEIFRRGQDRQEFRGDAVLWQARDIFYGSLEYSARSIELPAGGTSDRRTMKPVVDNLMALFASHYGADSAPSGAMPDKSSQLDRIESKLDRMLK